MTVVDRVHRDTELPDAVRAYARDTITLDWDHRSYAFGRRRTDGGVEFATALPRGRVLSDGDYLVLDPEHLLVAVVERREPVFVITPRSAQEWALFAYHIGNRHQPLMVADDALVCPEAPGVEEMLARYEMPYVRTTRPFTPAVAVIGHSLGT